jgi:hypothetical protein
MTVTDQILTSRKSTVIINSRCDRRTIAGLALFWLEQGEPCRSVSEIVRISIEHFWTLLLKSQRAKDIKTHDEAVKILSTIGVKTPQRLHGSLVNEMAKESLSLDGIEPSTHIKGKQFSDEHPLVADALRTLDSEIEGETLSDAHARREKDGVGEKDTLDELIKLREGGKTDAES